MTNVVLVCVAGVSGTFLARRMRQLDAGLSPVVATVESLPSLLPTADVVLIAPQLGSQADRLIGLAGGVPAVVLPADAYGPSGAQAAVDAVRSLPPGSDAAYRVSTTSPIKE